MKRKDIQHSGSQAFRRLSRVSNPGVENMENRELLAAPVMQPLADLNVPGNKSLIVPLSSTTSDLSAVNYTTTSTSEGIKTTILSGGTFIKMNVAGYGDLTFKLFDELAPETVGKIKSLVSTGFYDGLTFHRVIKNFMIQGGDPKGNGTGGTGSTFSDEFNANAIFSGSGQLALANSGKDTNSSQFFVTTSPQRSLDFNHTIFGQLVDGFDVLNTIQNVNTSKTDVPIMPVVVSRAMVVQDNSDAVMIVQVPEGTPASQLTVKATSTDGESSQQTINVFTYKDPINDPPILGKIADLATPLNQPVTFSVPASDLENDPLEINVVAMNNADKVSITTNGSAVTITPVQGFSGEVNLAVGVKQTGAAARGSTPSPWDTQVVKLTVQPPPISVTPVNNTVMEGQETGERVVAWFMDNTDPSTISNGNGASIEWGDGSASVGIIRPRVGGGFEILGRHKYANEGNYITTIRVGPKAEDGSAATTVAMASGSYVVSDAPLTAKGNNPSGIVAGQQWTGVLATFSDTNPTSPIGDYSALIRWGDGSIELASKIIRNAAGTIDVYGQHTYATAGRRTAQILIRDRGTSSTTAVAPIQVASATGVTPAPAPTSPANTGTTPPVTNPTPPPPASASPSTDGPLDPQTSGRLAASSDSGSSVSDGITNVKTPSFEGQTAPGATVKITATNLGGNKESIVLGTGTAGTDGKWYVTSTTPLADGNYSVAVAVTRGADQLSKTFMGGGASSGSALVIDTVAPAVTQIGYNVSTGQVRINAQDFGSGLNNTSWANALNYQITATAGRNAGQPISAATFRMVSTTAYPQATYNMILNRGFGPRPRSIQLSLNTTTLTDAAGNAVNGQTVYQVGNSKIINQLPKGVAQTIQNSRQDTSLANKILNLILPTGSRVKRF